MSRTFKEIDGKSVPHICGLPCEWDEKEPLIDAFSRWMCPICKAHLGSEFLICLNGCHLTKRQQEQFSSMMNDVVGTIDKGDNREPEELSSIPSSTANNI